ncbi:hypothetical protein CTAYLR_007669 [Chrysophaeum taylorii]|uniref:J domain-containing protein n=1 Tax=Chrysophaeum taylorii TaxID=2483200 RepID=A0AAD7U6Z9_9STRA|nr:hypothetical protein CTAYLR_007669 [Chrysophaeum taylorii]
MRVFGFGLALYHVVVLQVQAEEEGGVPDFYQLKCSACCSIVAELERNLEIEKPRMDIEIKRTIGFEQKSKVIDYSVSELRTLELLEGLCPGMQHYGVTTQEDGTASFQRHSVGGGSVHISGTMRIGTKKYHDDRLKLQSYCEAVVEEHEDLLSEAIRAAGVANLRKKEAESRLAAARRRGEEPTETDPYAVLGLDETATADQVRAKYRQLSRELHPDKTGGDPDAAKQFVAVTAAYEKATGEKHQPYEDLYRQVCVDIVGVCKDESEVDYVKSYFPKYYNSDRFQRPDDDAANKIAASPDAGENKKKKKKKKKKGGAHKAKDSKFVAAKTADL